MFDNHLKKRVGNPCDAIEVTELIKGIHNASRSRGDTAKRAAPMTISVICQLWEFIKLYMLTNPNVADEGLHVMARCSSCFCLWLRIDELFRL